MYGLRYGIKKSGLRPAHFARPVPVLDGLLACVVVDCILRRYLLCPAARDAMERLLVDAGHVLRGGQDSGCQEKNCEDRESEALAHGGLEVKRELVFI